MRAAVVLALAAVFVAPARADSLSEVFEEANAAYFRGDYDDAAEAYGRLEELGVIDADVTFNRATAEARRGRFGPAIQYYERTLWLRPGDGDAHDGLEAARSAVGRRRAERTGEAEVTTGPDLGDALFGAFSVDFLGVLALLFSVAFGILSGTLLFVRRETTRLSLAIAAPLLAAAFVATGTGALLRSGTFEDGPRAVVLRERAELREGPDARAAVLGRGLEGQRAFVLAEEPGFLRVRVADVGEGWMADDDIGLVRP